MFFNLFFIYLSNDTSNKKNNDYQKFLRRTLTSVMGLIKLYEPHLSFWTSRPRLDLDFCPGGILVLVCGKPFWLTSHWLVWIPQERRSDFSYCCSSLKLHLPSHHHCIVAVVLLHSFADSYASSVRHVASPRGRRRCLEDVRLRFLPSLAIIIWWAWGIRRRFVPRGSCARATGSCVGCPRPFSIFCRWRSYCFRCSFFFFLFYCIFPDDLALVNSRLTVSEVAFFVVFNKSFTAWECILMLNTPLHAQPEPFPLLVAYLTLHRSLWAHLPGRLKPTRTLHEGPRCKRGSFCFANLSNWWLCCTFYMKIRTQHCGISVYRLSVDFRSVTALSLFSIETCSLPPSFVST